MMEFSYIGVYLLFMEGKIKDGETLLASPPAPNLEYHPLSAICDCQINIFAADLQKWRLFIHPQPEDGPCWVTGTYHMRTGKVAARVLNGDCGSSSSSWSVTRKCYYNK
ncbi:uncharacterized protein LOC110833721 [Zootermopsis nevadensis]|uniref:uncharacterized protein LOC110833721 n=1 Tax=Zootermopsis nevadensis TaxID=136037 RepID=UPI000B8E238C|nr:uncharacterized protein LOC110833721 [Zootermopsis nevadensis]